MARIVTVYVGDRRPFRPTDMSYIRWLKMSQALAALGHHVDIATREPGRWRRWLPVPMGRRCRRVPLGRLRWDRYDVVKTLFHIGFETLEAHGGVGHPCIISKLGSVVGPRDDPAVYFAGRERERLFEIQQRIHAASRYVSLLTRPSLARWRAWHGDRDNLLLVPGAAADRVPVRRRHPFAGEAWRTCLFAGNIYTRDRQPEANLRLTASLNALGGALAAHRIRLYVIGGGDTSGIDRDTVRCLGPVPYARSWDYLRAADVGLVLALGPHPNENESTKIYHYLRVGLPIVCEAGFPNEELITDLPLGEIVPNGDVAAMAEAVERVARTEWDRGAAIDLILRHHTWRHRALGYHELLTTTCRPASITF